MIPQLAFVFPGQGSQSQGMLAELAAAHPLIVETFAEASEGAGVDLWQISLDNPEDRLNQTEFTQPALLAANIALWRLWQEQVLPQPAILSGHSLGEYAALVASGALSLKDGAHLVRLRGQFMQAAVPAGTGAMAAVLGAEDAQVEQICSETSTSTSVVVPANYNSPGQIVIGGHADAVDRAIAVLQAAGIRKTVKLAVSVPSHTPLMRDAATLAEVLAERCRQDAAVDVGSDAVLAEFAARRSSDRDGVTRLTDGLVKLFGDTRPGVPLLRDLGLLLFDLSPSAKQAMSRLSWGFSGQIPRLARGLPLPGVKSA